MYLIVVKHAFFSDFIIVFSIDVSNENKRKTFYSCCTFSLVRCGFCMQLPLLFPFLCLSFGSRCGFFVRRKEVRIERVSEKQQISDKERAMIV